ncbi:hypothetical protein TNCV_3338741 [Trichonephila clavipes]|nr:hypothetical protein TNCV_3338741 [Trichonephila clavipes]
MVLKAKTNDRRTSSLTHSNFTEQNLLPIATMNFVGLDLTLSDRWHEQQQQQQHTRAFRGLLKISHVEELMHVKYVEAQCPPIGVMWYFGDGLPAQMPFLSLDRGLKLRTRRQKSSCFFIV